ncbi:hypothetical protein [Streptomyces chiangmaiensis]|uniref:Uncharacterized protein n=1 Tax=Streptomyces chiangmaiensis TaxID=766497 RepID=A0ABU7FQ95_9ACTN|nr:hypothetical protein [Streptomyces chiangmaiensis]MED7826168.1 hypothetical protein [Streptomyces chiangmaiensis]
MTGPPVPHIFWPGTCHFDLSQGGGDLVPGSLRREREALSCQEGAGGDVDGVGEGLLADGLTMPFIAARLYASHAKKGYGTAIRPRVGE